VLCCLFAFRTYLTPTNIPIAKRANAPTPAATPIPAFAPVLRPGEGLGGASVVEGEGLVEVVGDAGVVDTLVEAAAEEVELDVVVTFDLMINARLDSWLLTKPFPVPTSPLGSLINRTKFGLSDIAASSTLSSCPMTQV
jgi:hypothetical protein